MLMEQTQLIHSYTKKNALHFYKKKDQQDCTPKKLTTKEGDGTILLSSL